MLIPSIWESWLMTDLTLFRFLTVNCMVWLACCPFTILCPFLKSTSSLMFKLAVSISSCWIKLEEATLKEDATFWFTRAKASAEVGAVYSILAEIVARLGSISTAELPAILIVLSSQHWELLLRNSEPRTRNPFNAIFIRSLNYYEKLKASNRINIHKN